MSPLAIALHTARLFDWQSRTQRAIRHPYVAQQLRELSKAWDVKALELTCSLKPSKAP